MRNALYTTLIAKRDATYTEARYVQPPGIQDGLKPGPIYTEAERLAAMRGDMCQLEDEGCTAFSWPRTIIQGALAAAVWGVIVVGVMAIVS